MRPILFERATIPAEDKNGVRLAGAKLRFYAAGTLNPADIFTTPDLDTPLGQPRTADVFGTFASPVWLDGAVSYRVVLTDASGSETYLDLDPYNLPATVQTEDIADGAVEADKCDPGLVIDLLGFTPLDRAGGTMSGELRLDPAPATLHSDTAGYLGAPTTTRDQDYTLKLADAGCILRHTSSSIHKFILPGSSDVNFPVGTLVGFRNVGDATLTLDEGEATMLAKGTGTPKPTLAIAKHGEAWIVKDSGDTWYVAGIGVT